MITELMEKFGIHHTHSGVYAGDRPSTRVNQVGFAWEREKLQP